MPISNLEKLKLPDALIEEINNHALIQSYTKGETIVSKGSFHNKYGILISGLLKVSVVHETNSLLIYHIDQDNIPFITFLDFKNNLPFTFELCAVENSTIYWLDIQNVLHWGDLYDSFRNYVFQSYSFQHLSLFNTLKSEKINSLNTKLYTYLVNKSKLLNSKQLAILNTEIAKDLNVSQNSISNALKILAKEKKIIKYTNTIAVL